MNLIEQILNTQENGIKGGQANLETVRQEIMDEYRGRKDKKKQKQENELMIKKLFYDIVRASGDAVIRQAIDDLIRDFNKGK